MEYSSIGCSGTGRLWGEQVQAAPVPPGPQLARPPIWRNPGTCGVAPGGTGRAAATPRTVHAASSASRTRVRGAGRGMAVARRQLGQLGQRGVGQAASGCGQVERGSTGHRNSQCEFAKGARRRGRTIIVAGEWHRTT